MSQNRRSVDAMIRAWCLNQIFPWQNKQVSTIQALEEYRHYNETRQSTFLFEVREGSISLLEKPGCSSAPSGIQSILFERAMSYLDFIRTATKSNRLIKNGIFAIEVGDGPLNSDTAPCFAFQKRVGDSAILLNDVNLIEGDFYVGPAFADSCDYSQKADSAVFAGATTGMHNDLASVKARSNQRVDAALFFQNVPNVDFRLPNIVQSNADAEELLRSMGFGQGGHMSWVDQLKHKHLISMDGNGATCQRVAVALKSNCTLLKYNSSSQLYYFDGLIPWYHYVPISSHQDVIDALELARRQPSMFATIAANGKEFSDSYLTKHCVSAYVSLLLQMYMDLFK